VGVQAGQLAQDAVVGGRGAHQHVADHHQVHNVQAEAVERDGRLEDSLGEAAAHVPHDGAVAAAARAL
jgi:hypothetical protein